MALSIRLTGSILLLVMVSVKGSSDRGRGYLWLNEGKRLQSKCDNRDDFIIGFYKNDLLFWNSTYLHVEDAEYFSWISPWDNTKSQVVYVGWPNALGRENSWVACPSGYFLNGLYKIEKSKDPLNNIEKGRCVKPADFPTDYEHRYDIDTSSCFDQTDLCGCNTGYYVTGIYQSSCDGLFCVKKFRCSKLASGPEQLDELYKVKTRIMDTTMSGMAKLASNLGYAWCGGCRSEAVGEDFRREGDTWVADKSGRCEGYMSDNRLSMVYDDWSFEIKEIAYGTPVVQDLIMETINTGAVHNNQNTADTRTVTNSVINSRRVTHTTTSYWKNSKELNVQIEYKPFNMGGAVSYKFNYETSTITANETNTENTYILQDTTSKVLEPFTAANWRFVLSNTKTSVNYTATIIPKFSIELQGFLRWGGGAESTYTNYHYQHRGSEDRPTLNFKFGDPGVPFYKALKRQSRDDSLPWLWNDLANAYPDLEDLINRLCNESQYKFTITGRFDDVKGKNAVFNWDAATVRKRSIDITEKNSNKIADNATLFSNDSLNDVPLS